MRPHPTYWLARRFRWRVDYLRTLFFDAMRWPETAPRTSHPVSFRSARP